MSQISGSRMLLVLGCLASAFAHSAALGRGTRAREPLPPSRVEFQIAAAKPAPTPETTPTAAPAPEPGKPRPAPAKALDPKPLTPTPIAAAPAAAAHTEPVDLRGLTLTADPGQGSFASLTGNGQSFDGPLGPAGRAAAPAPASSALPQALPSSAPPLVALADLSSRPTPPDLAGRLLDFYPAEAKRRGIAGTAQIRARIEADGRVRSASLLAETFDGFGSACRKTLVGSLWSAPRDRDGRAVATEIRYTCRFVVQP